MPADELERETMEIARKLADGPPLAIIGTKLQVYQGKRTDFGNDLERAEEGKRVTLAY